MPNLGEKPKPTSADWAVFRQDFTGNEFLVEKHLTEKRARELVVEFESHKHHQHYWAAQVPELPVDFSKMLGEILGSGSPLDNALLVLKNQGVTPLDCVQAICDVRKQELEVGLEIVVRSPVFSHLNQEQRNALKQSVENAGL